MVQSTTSFGGGNVVDSYSETTGNAGSGVASTTSMLCDTKFSQIKESITASDLKMLLTIVQEMLARELEILDNAVASRDVPVAKNALHKLKGLCGNYGLMILSEEAKDLETILKNDEDDVQDLDLSLFSSYIARAIGELKFTQATL